MPPNWSFEVCPEPSASALVIGGDVWALGGPACRQLALRWALSTASELDAALVQPPPAAERRAELLSVILVL